MCPWTSNWSPFFAFHSVLCFKVFTFSYDVDASAVILHVAEDTEVAGNIEQVVLFPFSRKLHNTSWHSFRQLSCSTCLETTTEPWIWWARWLPIVCAPKSRPSWLLPFLRLSAWQQVCFLSSPSNYKWLFLKLCKPIFCYWIKIFHTRVKHQQQAKTNKN